MVKSHRMKKYPRQKYVKKPFSTERLCTCWPAGCWRWSAWWLERREERWRGSGTVASSRTWSSARTLKCSGRSLPGRTELRPVRTALRGNVHATILCKRSPVSRSLKQAMSRQEEFVFKHRNVAVATPRVNTCESSKGNQTLNGACL